MSGWRVIAVDLRGHSDSQGPRDGRSSMYAYVGDLSELVRQHATGPVAIVAHSFGAKVALHYAGVYPESVRCLVAIEGLEVWPARRAHWEGLPAAQRLRVWIEDQRSIGARSPATYPSIEAAAERLLAKHQNLSAGQALHLARDGVRQREDGSFEWKYHANNWVPPPYDIVRSDTYDLWSRIECPVLLMHGATSHVPPPHPHLRHFRGAQTCVFAHSGHFPQHDELDLFIERVADFIDAGDTSGRDCALSINPT